MSRPSWCSINRALIAVAALLMAVSFAPAQPSKLWPWNVQGYQGYQPPAQPPENPPPPTTPSPQSYTLHINVLPKQHDDANKALLVAHLPEDARIWFEGEPTRQTGSLREFVTPPLTPGEPYTYTVRVQWPENGKWVSQLHTFPVHAGDIHCIDVIPTSAPTVKDEVAANLAKLDPKDRKAAEEQRYCAVQEGIRLGAMGVPVKIMVKGQPVFLCCEGCEKRAQSNPDRTLEKAHKATPKSEGSTSR